MAHPSRKDNVEKLLSVLGRDTPVSMDYESKGLLWNCVESWKLHDKNADFHCVLQDDVELTSDFKEKIEYHITKSHQEFGDLAYTFCLMNRPRFKGAVEEAKQKGLDYTLLNNLHTGNSICLPVKYINEMLKHYNTLDLPLDDARINSWVKKKGLKVYVPLPNLVNHLNPPSLHNYNKSALSSRVSIWFKK